MMRLEILLARRGSMYDPLIVDTFRPCSLRTGSRRRGLESSQARPQRDHTFTSDHNDLRPGRHPRLDDISASADEMLNTLRICESVGRAQADTSNTGDVVAKHLRRLIPFAQLALFLYDESTDEIVAKHTTGAGSSAAMGLRIPLGQRLSGWVAANRKTILNSDPVLDLGEVARTSRPRLRSCRNTPLVLRRPAPWSAHALFGCCGRVQR